MTEKPKYSYSPISGTEIRLLKFLKTDQSGICGTFQTFPIVKFPPQSPFPSAGPQYTALSYVWSIDGTSEAKSKEISIDGGHLRVLDSLWPFFEILQTKGTMLDGSWWWIDSICINQEDAAERSSQVKLMNSIYSLAACTTVWLGNASSDSDKAMDFIASVQKFRQDFNQSTVQKELQKEQYEAQWGALEKLLVRRWWERIWTMQEFILSPKIAFWCGLKTVSRAAISIAIWFFWECSPSELHRRPAFINGWHRRRVHEWYTRSVAIETARRFEISLVALASYCSNDGVTDDRDRLFGLCGLTPDIKLIRIDYELSVEEIYTDFTKAHIRHHEYLDIICLAQLYSSCSVDSPLPSWVPDWRKRLKQNFVTPFMVSQSSQKAIGNFRPPQFVRRNNSSASYRASGSTKPSFQFEGLNLVARGFVLDVIDRLGGSEDVNLTQSSEPSANALSTEASPSSKSSEEALLCLCSVVRSLVLGRRDRYLQNAAIPQAFFSDFLRFCSKLVQNNDSPDVPTDFKSWFVHNQHLRIHDGSPLESLVQSAALDTQFGLLDNSSVTFGSDSQSLNSFTGRFFDTVVRMSRRLMVSEKGVVGMVTEKARKGDLVCVLFGCNVPVVLRASLDDRETFVLVGECYFDGYMSGEAVGDESVTEREFCIC
jgi:hypothetical protein